MTDNFKKRYLLLNISKPNRCCSYLVRDVLSGQEEDMGLAKFKALLERDLVLNAMWVNKVKPTVNVREVLIETQKVLSNALKIGVNITKKRDTSRVYMKIYTINGLDISKLVGLSLTHRGYTYTPKGEVSCSTWGKDIEMKLIEDLKYECLNCGITPFVVSCTRLNKKR